MSNESEPNIPSQPAHEHENAPDQAADFAA